MPSPLPRRSGWTYSSLVSPCRISLPRKGCRVGLRVVLFEACSAFTHVAACTLARAPIRNPLSEGFSHFVTSMTAPVASGGSEIAGWAFHPLERCRLSTAHTRAGLYEQAMQRLHEHHPEDAEAAIFYALALNGAVDFDDQNYTNQLKAAAILNEEGQKQPNHP